MLFSTRLTSGYMSFRSSIRVDGRLLHSGETEVIRLAEYRRAEIILMDDRLAVVHARSLGIRVLPTVAIYLFAKRRGLIGSVGPKIDRLRAVGFRLSARDFQAVLEAAGEGV